MAKQLAKKFINLFIVLALLTLSLTAPVTAEDNPGEEGVAKQSEAVLALKAFGLLDEEGLDLSSDVTRGSFITVMARIIGASSPANTAFSDVDAGSSLSGAINVATGMGLIAGYGDGTFRPNEPITKMQAAKILVSLLGYDAMALSQGGYPGGYLSVASSLGILRKVEMTGLDKCAWNDAAWLIYNSLDVDLMKNTKYPSETYEVAKGETILSKWLNIRKIEGLIEANDITSLSAPEGVRDGFVKVGGALYFAGKTDAGTFLGHYVKCFYKEDNEGDDTLLLVLPKDTMAIYEFDGSDVENAATGFIEFFNEKNI